jgi:hypothetical protein
MLLYDIVWVFLMLNYLTEVRRIAGNRRPQRRPAGGFGGWGASQLTKPDRPSGARHGRWAVHARRR